MKLRDLALQVVLGLIVPGILYSLFFHFGQVNCNMPLDKFVSYISVVLSIISILTGFEFTAVSIIVGLLLTAKVEREKVKRIIIQFLLPLIMMVLTLLIILFRLFIFVDDVVIGNYEVIAFLSLFTFLCILIVYTTYIFYLLITNDLFPKKPER